MLRNIPLDLSYKLSVMVADTKLYGVAYIGGLFFCMPLGIIFASV